MSFGGKLFFVFLFGGEGFFNWACVTRTIVSQPLHVRATTDVKLLSMILIVNQRQPILHSVVIDVHVNKSTNSPIK